jgi:hypothetical protein
MQRSGKDRVLPRIGKTLAIAAALLGAVALGQPGRADAAPHGGGGGFHGSGSVGMRGTGFHGGGFAGGGFHGGSAGGRYGAGMGRAFGVGVGLGLVPYTWGWWGNAPYYGDYDYIQPYPAQTWYYCSDPAGYYPYVPQCSTGWQAVPAS